MPTALQDYATLPLPLTSIEKEQLADYEATIRRGLNTFYAVGGALVGIRNLKLYRGEFRTFEDYCAQRWQIGRASAYRMIDAAEVKENLSPIGDKLPENESQVRALKAAPPELRADIWQKAQATAPNGKVTAKHIDQVIQMELPREPEPPPAPKPARPINMHVPLYYEIIKNTMPDQIFKITAPVLHTPEPEGEETLTTRLERCQACLGKCYFTDKGITKIYEINTMLGKVRGVTYPWPPGSQKYAAITANFTLEELRYQVNLRDWEWAKTGQPPEPEPEEDLYHDARAQGMMDDYPDEETAQMNDRPFGWQTQDREKICKAGLRIFRVIDTGRLELRELLPPKNTYSTQRTWQLFNTYETKAALQRRIKDLEQDDHIIFENRL